MELKRKLVFLFIVVLSSASYCFAQNTTVSGTITDTPDGQAWFGGTFSFVFRVSPSNPTAQYFFNGVPFSSSQTIAGPLDGSGHYSQGVPPNTSITPSGSTWDVTFCPLATAQCATYQSVTVTGATQTFSPSPPSIRINLAVPLQNPRAYTDTEVVNGALGQTYFNLSSTFIRVCSVFPCGWTNSGSGGSSITLKTNGTTNPVQSLLNIIGGTAITATADGSGGVTIASTIGPPCNSLGVLQAGNGTGGYNCTNVSESGSVLTNKDTNSNRGPNPSVDITVPPFNARAVSTSLVPTTTGTITGGTNSLVVASNSGWQVNDGLSLIGGGATNCATAPLPPTVTPSLASSMTGTGHAVAGATGSTSYSYVVIAISQGGCYTAASAVGSTSTGNATLGATNIPITSCANVSGTVTCTVGSTTGLATGMWVRIGGTSDDLEFGDRHNITVLNGTQFTFLSNMSSIYPMTSTTATGGTLYYWVENHIVLPPLPTGTNLYKFAVYRCTGASCALPANAGNYSLVYISYPANLGLIDVAYNTWDDYGSISTVTIGLSAPWYIPSTPPATNVNDMLVTTVTNIAGTTFTLAANATNNTSSAPMRFDDAPAITAAEAALNTTSSGGGGSLHIPPPVESGVGGTLCYVTSSYVVLNSITNVGGAMCPGETVELSGAHGALLGTAEETVRSVIDVSTNQTLLSWICFGANPCIWRKGPQVKNLFINTSGPSEMLMVRSGVGTQALTENVGFNVPDAMGIAYWSNATFGDVMKNVGFAAGNAQVVGSIDTPLFIERDGIQTTIDGINGSRRGLYFECTNNPGFGCQFNITVRQGNEWQGPITPLVTVNAANGGVYGMIWLEHMIQDSGAESIFVNASSGGNDLSPLFINGTDLPGRDPSAPLGDSHPIIGGNQFFSGVSLIATNPIVTASAGMNHDLNVCLGQPGSNQVGYTGCSLPSLNLAAASYGISHTLNASEGIVKATASGITFTLPHALAGQTWEVYNPTAGTITLTIDSGTLSGGGATGPITIPANQGVWAACDGTNCNALGLGGSGGGGSPGGITDALQYNGGGSSFGGVNSPTVNGNYIVNYNVTASAAVPPTITIPGVLQNVQTGTTYTYLYSDRGSRVTANNAAAQTYTLVNPSSTGFGQNYFNILQNIGTGVVTDTASGFTVDGGTTLKVNPNWGRWLWSDGINYFSLRVPDLKAFPTCVDTGGNHINFDPTATNPIFCGTSASGNGLSGMTAGQVPIAASATSVTSSEALAGAGAAIVTGPSTSVSTDLVTYTGTAGQTADSGVLLANVWRKDVANISAAVNHDFSAGTWKIPSAAGFTAGATSNFGLDTTAKLFHCYLNNADAVCSALSTISPATTSNTIANGNNPQTWNFLQTTNNQNAFTIGNAVGSPSTGGTFNTNGTANQGSLAVVTSSNSTEVPLNITGGSQTGTTGPPIAQFLATWNNASLVGKGLIVAVTNSNSLSTSHLLDLLGGAAGTTNEGFIDSAGNEVINGGLTVSANLAVKAGAASTGLDYIGGSDAGSTGAVGRGRFRGGDNSNNTTSGAAGGGFIGRGGAETGATIASVGGYAFIISGPVTSTSGTPGTLEVAQSMLGSSLTLNTAVCATSTAWTVGTCTTTSTNWGAFIGIAMATGTPVAVIQHGIAPVVATAAVTIGHTACLSASTANDITDSGGAAACANGPTFVIVATSGTINVINAAGTDVTTATLSTTLPAVRF